jgi:hypothetical protein
VTDIAIYECLFSELDIACKPNLFGVDLIFIAMPRPATRPYKYSMPGQISTPAITEAFAAASA